MKKKHHKLQLGKKILMCILVASMVLGNVGAAPVAYALEDDSQETEAPLAQEENTGASEDEVNSADETVDVDQKKDGEPAETSDKKEVSEETENTGSTEEKKDTVEKTEEKEAETSEGNSDVQSPAEQKTPANTAEKEPAAAEPEVKEETEVEKLARLKELVDAFPEEAELWWLDKEELVTLYETFVEIGDLYDSLSDEAKNQIDMGKMEAAGEFYASYIDPLSLSNTGDITSIPPAYGTGIIYEGRKSTAIYGPGWKDGRWADNTSKNGNIWIKYPSAGSFYVNGEHTKVDVVVYYWKTEGDAYVADSFGQDLISIASPVWCGFDPQDFTVEMEYHFYRAGTNEELPVDGYLFAHDLDINEGVCGKDGTRGYYTSGNTTMRWKGSYITGTVDDDRTDYSMSVGVAFHAEAGAPFRLSYHGCEYYSIELSSVGVDGKLLKSYGNLNVTKNITNPSNYMTSPTGFSMNLKGTSAYGDSINQTVKTNASGVASFTNIPMGTYTVTEQGAASYWDVPASGKINIEAGQTGTYAVNNIYKTGNVVITKTIETAPADAYNAEAEKAHHYNDTLSGFAYRLSGTSESGVSIVKYGVTDASGKLTFSNLPVGTYDVKELKASEVPEGEACKAAATQELYQYVIPDSQKVTVSYDTAQHMGNTTQVTFHNALKKWSFSGTAEPNNSLVKIDEDVRAMNITQGDATLAGAVYGLYDGDKLVATATTDETGHYDFAGTYVVGDLWQVKEITAARGYLLDPVAYTVGACAEDLAVQTDDIYQAQLENATLGNGLVGEQVKKQSLSFYKVTGTDKESSYEAVAGAKFSIYRVADLADGKYVNVSDAELPQAIIDDYRNPKTLDFNAFRSVQPAVVYAGGHSADVQSGRLVKTVDYGADGSFHVTDGYLVAELESNSRGVVTTPELPYGRYIVVETTTPENKIATRPFVLNITGDDEDGEVKGDGQGQPLENLVIAVDRPITALIRIKKLDSNSHKMVLKAGAGYVIHDTDGAWFNYYTAEMTSAEKKAYKDKYGDLVVQSSQGEILGTVENPYTTRKIAQAESTGNVYVDTPVALPVGTYTLEEVNAPEGYILQGKEGVIAKKDSAPGNHTFYETEATGAWDAGTSSTVNIVVSSQEAVFDTGANAFVIAASQQNDSAIGKISVYAEGEKLASAQQDGVTILDRLGESAKNFFGYIRGLIGLDTPDENGLTEKELSEYKDYTFTYETKPISGAEFEVRAAEDIYSQEGGANATKLYSAGDLVVTLTTDDNGQAWTGQEDWDGTNVAKGLPLGKYTVTQTKAGTGFALSTDNAKPREVEIAYAGQEVPVIYRDSSYENPRQKVSVEIQKLDAEQNEPLAGAVFGLYAEKDIANYAGKTVVKAGTLIATGETTVGADGQVQKAVFTPDLPLGKYYIKELQAPMGYTTTQSKISLDASYREDQREVIGFSETVKNAPVLLQVNVMDYHTEEELDGATLQLMDEDGNTFILSVHGNNEIIRGLEINKTYTLQELVSPQGYHYNLYLKDDYNTEKPDAVEADKAYVDGEVSDKITFTVSDVGLLQVVSVFNKPITGELTVEKTGQVPTGTEDGTDANGNKLVTPIYEVKGLPGAEYALIATEDIVYPDGYTGTLFAAGDTVLDRYQELKATTLKNYTLEVPVGELVDVSEYIGKVPDEDATREEISGFYRQNKNNVQRSLLDGTAVHYVLRTNEEGKVQITGLPLGEYKIVEVKAPNGYYRDQTDCTREVSLLEPEESGRPEEVVTAKTAFENAKQEIQEPDQSQQVPDPTAIVYHPAIQVTKNAEKSVYDPGETVAYHIVVTNTGDVELEDVTIEDSLAGGVIKTIASLAVGESQVFTYEYQIPEDAAVGSRINNVVKATGTPVVPDPGADNYGRDIPVDPVSYEKPVDSDAEKVLVRGGAIQVLKTAQERIYRPGDVAVYEITVVNPTGQTIKDITVKDSLGGIFKLQSDDNLELNSDGTVTVKELQAGAQVVLKYSWKVPDGTTGSVENTVWVKGTADNPEGTIEVEDEDSTSIVVLNPQIRITKYAEKQTYEPGERVKYCIKVENTGNCDLTHVEVTEQLLTGGRFEGPGLPILDAEDPKYMIETLGAGETAEFAYYDTVSGDARTGEAIYNHVTVTGKPSPVADPVNPENPDGTHNYIPVNPVHDSADAVVYVNQPDYGMAVTKYSMDEGSRTPTAGAAFTVYAKEDVTNILGDVVYAAGTEIETAISGEDGVARFQTDFPIGMYVVRETKAPAGHYSSTKEIAFDLADQKYNDGVQYLHYWDYVENAITEVNIKLVDDLTGNELAGASLNITDVAGNPVKAWITKTEDGYTVKGLDVDTDYTITETVPREGYLVDFTGVAIRSQNASIAQPAGPKVSFRLTDIPIDGKAAIPERTDIRIENSYVIGNVRVNKDGEMLESWTLLDQLTAFVKSLFGYSKEALEGVAFEVRAAEDIVHPDGVTGIVYHKGDVVATNVRSTRDMAVGTTDATGTVCFEGMYVGKYELYETKTAEGYLRDTEPAAFALAYVDGHTSPVSAVGGDILITNPRQKAEVTVIKTDVETGEKLSGAVIGLYATNDIKNHNGAVIVPANTLLETGESDAEGKVVFESDLPLGSYYVKEISAPAGYLVNKEAQKFEFTYAGDAEEIVRLELGIADQPNDVRLEVQKSTITDTKPGRTYLYTIDRVRNTGNCIVNEFALTDTLPDKVELVELNTGTFDGLKDSTVYSIWYKTNQNSEFRLWKEKIPSNTNVKLAVSDLNLASKERITVFQYRFGDVKKGFKELETPQYSVKVMDSASNGEELVNVVELTGSKLGTDYRAESRTLTKVHRDRKHHGSSPASSVQAPKTGDTADIAVWVILIVGSVGILGILATVTRKKHREKEAQRKD